MFFYLKGPGQKHLQQHSAASVGCSLAHTGFRRRLEAEKMVAIFIYIYIHTYIYIYHAMRSCYIPQMSVKYGEAWENK